MYPTLSFVEIMLSPKIRTLLSELLVAARPPSPSLVDNRPTTVACLSTLSGAQLCVPRDGRVVARRADRSAAAETQCCLLWS